MALWKPGTLALELGEGRAAFRAVPLRKGKQNKNPYVKKRPRKPEAAESSSSFDAYSAAWP
jgi:hypothetical protein